MLHDLDSIAYAFNFAEQMRGKDHAVRIAQFAYQCTNFADLRGIETNRGFIQHDHIGVVDDGLSNADTLLITLGQVADDLIAERFQAATLSGFRQRSCD
jgi:hypothetical protein